MQILDPPFSESHASPKPPKKLSPPQDEIIPHTPSPTYPGQHLTKVRSHASAATNCELHEMRSASFDIWAVLARSLSLIFGGESGGHHLQLRDLEGLEWRRRSRGMGGA